MEIFFVLVIWAFIGLIRTFFEDFNIYNDYSLGDRVMITFWYGPFLWIFGICYILHRFIAGIVNLFKEILDEIGKR